MRVSIREITTNSIGELETIHCHKTSLEQFFKDNSFDTIEEDEISRNLKRRGKYIYGGGASVTFVITKLIPKQFHVYWGEGYAPPVVSDKIDVTIIVVGEEFFSTDNNFSFREIKLVDELRLGEAASFCGLEVCSVVRMK